MLYALALALCCFIFVLLPVYYIYIYPTFVSPLRHLPGPPNGSVLGGQFPNIMKSEAGILQREWVKEHGPVVRAVGPLGLERVIFTKPEALSRILVGGWTEYPRPAFMRNTLGMVAGWGLLTVTGNEHRQMRKAMNPAFSIPNLMAQTDMYYDAIHGLLKILRNQITQEPDPKQGKRILMYEWMSKVTLDIICTTAFGYNADSLHNPHNELAAAYEELISMQTGPNLARFIAILSIPGGPRLLRSSWAYEHRHWFEKIGHLKQASVLLDCMHRIKAVSRSMLNEKINEAAAIGVDDMSLAGKKDIMSLLVRARKAEADANPGHAASPFKTVADIVDDEKGSSSSYRMTDEMLMDQVLTFLGAGHETTASGLAWTLWLLAKNPDAQKKLREEVSSAFRSNLRGDEREPTEVEDLRPDYRTLKDLQWLDCVVMESLRLYPPVPMSFRQALKTEYVDGVLIPKGTILYIPIRVVNTWGVIWGDDAEEFNPSRWLNLPPTYHPTLSFLSFLAGPHACIGKTMSIMEMKAVLGALIANFEFSPAYDGQVAQPTAAVTMKPRDDMPLLVKLA